MVELFLTKQLPEIFIGWVYPSDTLKDVEGGRG
jgi:hypothetical protein